jgi:Asp-tRNA(Asn)/Glu-tRNA(Gln) amidotransferase A subunit family amidase
MDGAVTAAGIAEAVRAGRSRARMIVDDALDRIAATNGALNAFCEVRASLARAAADRVDAQVAAGHDPGPLAGVPIAVKDVIWEAGIETTDGSRALVGFVPDENAAIIDRLVGAGAVIVGRTNQPEFCYRGISANDLYGTTANPWDLGRTPGGSSGGSAAAVAAGLVPLAVGTDGGGSVRIPASFCGVVGFKATYGVVPREPQWPGWWTLTHIGPIANSVEDCALMLSVMAGPDDRDPVSLPVLGDDYAAAVREPGDLRGLRVAYSEDLGYITRIDPAVRSSFRDAVERFRSLGAEMEEAHPDVENPIDHWNTLATVDNYASEGTLLRTGRVGLDTVALIEAGAGVSGRAYAEARNAQMAFASAVARFMRRYDLLLTPAMECVAFPHGRVNPAVIGGEEIGDFFDDWCHFCYASNMTGQPAISIPMNAAEHGLPVGLQIIGRRFDDPLVLRAAACWQRIAPWPAPPIVPRTATLAAGVRTTTPTETRTIRRIYRPGPDDTVVTVHDPLAETGSV